MSRTYVHAPVEVRRARKAGVKLDRRLRAHTTERARHRLYSILVEMGVGRAVAWEAAWAFEDDLLGGKPDHIDMARGFAKESSLAYNAKRLNKRDRRNVRAMLAQGIQDDPLFTRNSDLYDF